jgi:hypothetical protein
MPLSEVFGKEGTLPPAQMVRALPKLNEGVMFGFTVTLTEVERAHCPASGVNV